MIYFVNLLLTATLLAVPSPTDSLQTVLLNDMAALDAQYIPALALTNKGDEHASRLAIRRLNTHWKTFKKKWSGYSTDDIHWKASLNDVHRHIDQAAAQIQAGELPEAHELLEEVRSLMMETRQRNHIPYFLDYLTAFHDPMEEVVMVASGSISIDSSTTRIQFVQENLPELQRLWRNVESADRQREIFHLKPDDWSNIESLISEEKDAITALKKAVKMQEEALIIRRAQAIKPPFVELYLSFGKFQSQ